MRVATFISGSLSLSFFFLYFSSFLPHRQCVGIPGLGIEPTQHSSNQSHSSENQEPQPPRPSKNSQGLFLILRCFVFHSFFSPSPLFPSFFPCFFLFFFLCFFFFLSLFLSFPQKIEIFINKTACTRLLQRLRKIILNLNNSK